MIRWLRRLPNSTQSWNCPWFMSIIALCSASTVAFCYENMPIPASASAWLAGYLIGDRR